MSVLEEVHKEFLVMIIFSEIPVPISNTEVKTKYADDTRELPCLENRYCQILYSSLAQLVERSAVNR